MSQEYCILNLLNIEDKNIKLVLIDGETGALTNTGVEYPVKKDVSA